MLSLLPAPNQPPRRRVRAISPFRRRRIHSGQRIGLTTIRCLTIISGYRAGSFYRGYSYPSQCTVAFAGLPIYHIRLWGIYVGATASGKPGNLAKLAGHPAGRGLSSLTSAATWLSRPAPTPTPRPTKRAPRWICILTGYPTAGRRITSGNTLAGIPTRPRFTAGLGIYRKRRMMCYGH